jgi:chemotaxis protein MotA
MRSSDKASVGGALLGLTAVVGGLLLEGETISQILQPTAALIVFGGTAGAVLIQFPLAIVVGALRKLREIFSEPGEGLEPVMELLLRLANTARRHGIVSLDAELDSLEDPFLRKVLMLAVDGTEPAELRKIADLELNNLDEREEKLPLVFEAAGGFSPTIGIIGAVLGLIQVMQHLDQIDQVGHGIAVAFVATIYGVGAANLLLLPAAGKLRIRHREEQIRREMILEGVISILEGMNPRILQISLRSYLAEPGAQANANVAETNARGKAAGA